MIKYLSCFSFLFILVSSNVFGTSYSEAHTISQMTVGKEFARVKMSNMIAYEGCSRSDYYILSFADSGSSEMYSMLLAAKLSGEKLKFQLIGCKSNFAEITHIYN